MLVVEVVAVVAAAVLIVVGVVIIHVFVGSSATTNPGTMAPPAIMVTSTNLQREPGALYLQWNDKQFDKHRLFKSIQARKKNLVESQNVEVRSIECISNPNALYKSFKLTVPKSQLETIFNDTFPWPSGERVRNFYNMRRTAEHNHAEKWDSDSNRNN